MAERPPEHFDVVVVGSGFGGAVLAGRLAAAGRAVLVLERGQPWAPGSFPRTPRQAKRAFWEPRAGAHGLFDVWSFSGLEAVVASGLGGGSLIYANVLMRKDAATFVRDEHERWPVGFADLEPHYARVEEALGATRYPLHAEPYASTPKTRAMLDAAAAEGLSAELPHLAVAFAPDRAPGSAPRPGVALADQRNLHGAPRETCRLIGECDVGCQLGAKHTLDLTYLSAALRDGAQVRTCCEAVGLARRDGGWEVRYEQHLAARDGHPEPLLDPVAAPRRTVFAPRVVVAAGTFGTARLLLRNRAGLPGLSPRLGTGFSANGDLLMFLRGTDRPLDPSRGPVITASVGVAGSEAPGGRGFQLQDAGAPQATEWLWQAGALPGDLWRARGQLGRRLAARLRGRRDTSLGGELAAVLGTTRSSSAMMPLLGMGRDVPDGRFTVRGEALELSWSERPSRSFFEDLEATGRRLGRALGGRTIRPLGRFSRLMTVHPLGGCPMGRSWEEGVVDAHGRVFRFPGLYVADGSIMPGPVGANPSLTIAAMADRIADGILTEP